MRAETCSFFAKHIVFAVISLIHTVYRHTQLCCLLPNHLPINRLFSKSSFNARIMFLQTAIHSKTK